MTPLEEALIRSLADIATATTEIGKAQATMANFICQHLPDLSEADKQEMLDVAETTWHQQQKLQDSAVKLRKLL